MSLKFCFFLIALFSVQSSGQDLMSNTVNLGKLNVSTNANEKGDFDEIRFAIDSFWGDVEFQPFVGKISGLKPQSNAWTRDGKRLELNLSDSSQLQVNEVTAQNPYGVGHYVIAWHRLDDDAELCFDYNDDNDWYKTFESYNEPWPLDKSQKQDRQPFVTGDFFQKGIGPVVENLWLSNSGYTIYVDKETPLFVRFDNANGGRLCLSASYRRHPFHSETPDDKSLIVHMIAAPCARNGWLYTSDLFFKKPTAAPDERMLRYPIWSTWARYKKDINQAKTLEFAEEINAHGFPNAQLEIDDDWETCYGDQEFNLKKFPDPKAMVDQLHKMGFRVTFWVHPFVNSDCKRFVEGSDQGLFVKDRNGSVLVNKWWDGATAAVIDFTNPKSVTWFVDRLENLKKKFGIDSFKFDAGEVSWLSDGARLHDTGALQRPSLFTKAYVEAVAKLGRAVETRVAYDSQEFPLFVRMLDKQSTWGADDGIRSLIPTAFVMGLAGYPFVLPDMVGGNGYGGRPDKELFLRWLEVNVFMPSLQFSYVPWDYDNETVAISKKLLELRERHFGLITWLANDGVRTGKPIIRPAWWKEPRDPKTWKIDDQFYLGDDILVAPVVDKGVEKRDIYLPLGIWHDKHGKIITTNVDGLLLKDYPAKVGDIPYFSRL